MVDSVPHPIPTSPTCTVNCIDPNLQLHVVPTELAPLLPVLVYDPTLRLNSALLVLRSLAIYSLHGTQALLLLYTC